MRHLTFRILGRFEVFDLAFGAADELLEPEFETYQDAGSTGSTVVGFTADIGAQWERPLNTWDEPDA